MSGAREICSLRRATHRDVGNTHGVGNTIGATHRDVGNTHGVGNTIGATHRDVGNTQRVGNTIGATHRDVGNTQRVGNTIGAACAATLAVAATLAHAQDTHDHAQHQDASVEADVLDHSAHQEPQSDAQDHSAHADHAQHTQPTESERAHVPPDPPARPMPDVSEERMIELMQMEDDAPFGMIQLDQLEWREIHDEDAQAWELQAYYGTDYNKIWFETEGERAERDESGRAELLWDRILSPWWSIQSGVRHDSSEGPSRTWAAIGLQGLAPYFFEIDAALYIGEQGRTAARFSAEYDMLITQRWVLQPELEVQLYGKDDTANGLGSGLADAELGIRLRYEIRRELAPYIGIHWERKFGETADLSRASGEDVDDLSFVAGVRAWF